MKIEMKLTESTTKDFANELFAAYNYVFKIVVTDEDAGPIPWDASGYIKDGMFMMEGSAGSNGWGYCCTGIPLKDAIDMITLEVNVGDAEVMEVLKFMTDNLNLRIYRVN